MWFKEWWLKLLPKKAETNYNTRKSFDEIYEDLGAFYYTDDGFTISHDGFERKVMWNDITMINAYKKDLLAIDRIEMEIVCGDQYFVVTEDLPGWFQFVIKLKEVFETIPKDWDLNIIHPAFERNFTTIYTKLK
ncbi:hypothetical protein [Flavobacterium capsici]|uniref:Uncharacterized protein n=1 Tax=Flavobacterium capsici TaxID=3075618 RepID=A0AA96EXN1_9FLAO|nr:MULTISPECIES: hypothetical protein [unclassified Flavobacterium]WNM20379.1 hypothetical protein RN608_06780 [Flavobacterium sp. PMR2A8]WNM21769.1 hypothetical protein RN605_00080 [Flavobacterium sp. PMTSA4]